VPETEPIVEAVPGRGSTNRRPAPATGRRELMSRHRLPRRRDPNGAVRPERRRRRRRGRMGQPAQRADLRNGASVVAVDFCN
jgi:hypothetical protein